MPLLPSIPLLRWRVLLALGPVLLLLPAAAAAYLLYVARHTTAHYARICPPRGSLGDSSEPPLLTPVPAHVRARGVLALERVLSRPVTVRRRPRADLLTAYLRATMQAFAGLPQARAMRARMPKRPGSRATFDPAYLRDCEFEVGDRVCGVYVVGRRESADGGDVVVMDFSPPEGWSGPLVRGRLGVGVVVEGEGVRNENFTVNGFRTFVMVNYVLSDG
ncbi:hypothetical protein F4780DRAFT_784083 [Xylariomycetidae sp. FL0641]|nr:hypothetical protein F4780DRAFT_784083 [Xylariomycetidae sp. FL0641]